MSNDNDEKRSFLGPNSTCNEEFDSDNSFESSLDISMNPTCSISIEEKRKQLTCALCNSKFSTTSNLNKHMKAKHPDVPIPAKEKKLLKYQCSECPRQFSQKYHMNYHLKKDHQILQKINVVSCVYCRMDIDANELLNHYENEHDQKFEMETVTFDSYDKFISWKNIEESVTCSKYNMQRSANSEDKKYIYFLCHRSGFYHPSVTDRKRALKSQGSYKINDVCPAKMKVTVNSDGRCSVCYVKTHVAHKTLEDLGHISLSPDERQALATQIALKLPLDTILDNIRNSITESNCSRIHLISKKDLHNIENSFNLTSSAVRHKEDGISVESWVREMSQESGESCVLFYKPQGVVFDDFPMFTKDDFCLMIMNEAQKEMLAKFGSDCVCLDSTHGLNQYNLELTTLLVVDEFREGFPCAFMFSKSPNEEILSVFFAKIKERMQSMNEKTSANGVVSLGPKIPKPKVFMSDMAECFFNAWNRKMEMAEEGMRLFCTWHVDKAWRNNLKKIRNEEKRLEVYKLLRMLLVESDKVAFHKLLDQGISFLLNDPETAEFGVYFEKYYKKCKESWAYCYRLQAGLNTNMHLESFHNVIKRVYLDGRCVKRLDKAIHVLMKFVKDKTVDKLISLHKGKVSFKVKELRKRHKTSLTMDSQVLADGENWNVTSSSCDDIYIISRVKTENCDCKLKCEDCQACLHMYSCTCIDSAVRWNMCKHIHFLCCFLNSTTEDRSSEQSISNEILTIDDDFESDKSMLLENISKLNRPCELNTDKNTEICVNKFQSILHQIKTQEGWAYVMKTLNSMEHTIAALNLGASSADVMKNKVSVTKRNMDIQRRLYSTKRKRKLPCRSLRKPDRTESLKIATNLLLNESNGQKVEETVAAMNTDLRVSTDDSRTGSEQNTNVQRSAPENLKPRLELKCRLTNSLKVSADRLLNKAKRRKLNEKTVLNVMPLSTLSLESSPSPASSLTPVSNLATVLKLSSVSSLAPVSDVNLHIGT